eukprot:c15795_g1_i2 orf=442-1032(+)
MKDSPHIECNCTTNTNRQIEWAANSISNEEGGPLNMIHKIDRIINRLVESCSCSSKLEYNRTLLRSSEISLDPRQLEQRLDSIIVRLSQRGQLGRVQNTETYPSPSSKCESIESQNSTNIIPVAMGSTSVTSNTAEKLDPYASPSRRRSAKFISVLSLLASPRSAHSPRFKGLRQQLGSPKFRSPGLYMDGWIEDI